MNAYRISMNVRSSTSGQSASKMGWRRLCKRFRYSWFRSWHSRQETKTDPNILHANQSESQSEPPQTTSLKTMIIIPIPWKVPEAMIPGCCYFHPASSSPCVAARLSLLRPRPCWNPQVATVIVHWHQFGEGWKPNRMSKYVEHS